MRNRFICAEEVAQELSVSKPYAYKLIRQLNEELKGQHSCPYKCRRICVHAGYGNEFVNVCLCNHSR